MNEPKQVAEIINPIMQELRQLRRIVEKNQHVSSSPLITVMDMCTDLGVSRRTFYDKLLPTMPFLFKLGQTGQYRAKINDYEKWKEELVEKFQ